MGTIKRFTPEDDMAFNELLNAGKEMLPPQPSEKIWYFNQANYNDMTTSIQDLREAFSKIKCPDGQIIFELYEPTHINRAYNLVIKMLGPMFYLKDIRNTICSIKIPKETNMGFYSNKDALIISIVYKNILCELH